MRKLAEHPAGIVERAARWRELGPPRLLYALLFADLVFVGLYVIHAGTPYLEPALFSISTDRGLAESFQYLKFGWIAAVFAMLVRLERERAYLAWVALFAFLLVDDALELHERGGGALAERFGFAPMLGLRPEDFGELLVVGAAGLVLLALLAVAFARGSTAFRRRSGAMLGLLVLLAVAGVAADMLHVVFSEPRWLRGALAVAEDGGEMVVASVMCWYATGLRARVRAARSARSPARAA